MIDAFQIAKICHEANKAYCETIGDNSQVSWAEAPAWQMDSAILGVNFHIKNPNAGPSGSHESWLKVKEKEGWKYGPIKDAVKKEHPCYVSYSQLPFEQRMKDYIFSSIVHAFVKAEKDASSN